MHLPPRVVSIERMTPAVARAWAVTHACEWCPEPPAYFVRFRVPPRGAKKFKLACLEHAKEASAQTGLGLEDAEGH
jgi:hypothetical protein